MRPKYAVVKHSAVIGGGSVIWGIKEKERLLRALKRYGTADIERLAAEVGTKDVVAVKGFLDQRRSQLRLAKNKAKTDPVHTYLHNWQKYMHRAKDQKLRTTDRAQILTEIVAGCTEKDFPQPTHDLEPNFGELYRYLADVMRDQIPAELSVTDSWVLKHLMRSVADTVKQMDLKAEKHALQCAVTHVENTSRWGEPEANAQVTSESSKDVSNSDEVDPSPKTNPALPRMAQDDPSCRSQTFRGQPHYPPWKTRANTVSATWNSLQIPPDVLHQEHAHITSMWYN
ncbi:uncharacterized protein LOC135401007 [Ornithodoros turicata]